MELSLVPASSLNISLRDWTNRVPQANQESSSPSWTAANPAILLKTYQPAANTFFIDSEVLQRFESVDPSKAALPRRNYSPQTAKTLYQKTTTNQQSMEHAVDLYV